MRSILQNLKQQLCALTVLASLFMALLSIQKVHAEETFYFTAIPDQDETRLKQRFNQIAEYLKAETGLNAQYIPVKSYAAAITAFKNNQVQLAWFGGLSGVKARALVSGSEAIAQGYEDQFFKTYIIAHTSTGLTSANGYPSDSFPADIADKRFTFGSKGSTSGRLMPEFYIRQQFNKAPEQIFSNVGFSGDHSRTIALVQAGSYEIGAVNFKVWEKELKAGLIDTAKVQVIWETPTYPDYQWSIRGDIDQQFGAGSKQKVTDALLGMTDPKLLEQFPRKSFVKATNQDYQPIEDTARKIGLLD